MTEPRDTLRVSKKISPEQAGALKLARKYGDALIYVRYHVDAGRLHRYTTVEFIVDRVPIVKRVDRIVGVRIRRDDIAVSRQGRQQQGALADRQSAGAGCRP